MNKSKIEWCDYTWNPVTGCLHGCNYCYARRIAERFGGASETHYNECVGEECQWCTEGTGKIHDLTEPVYDIDRGHNAPYPFEFDPTFHRYRLDEPQKVKKPSKIFVVSMGDLFGDWVPDEWIEEVFKACEAAPQHTYMFLTKNPLGLKYPFHLFFYHNENSWIGTSITRISELRRAQHLLDETAEKTNRFISIEPLLGDLGYIPELRDFKWIIVGAQTGPGAVPPKPEWVQNIIDQCRAVEVPIFLKNNLNWPEKIQEFPERMGVQA